MRQTREVVIVVFAITVGAGLTVALAGLLLIEIVHPATNTTDGFSVVWNVLSLMLGGIAGYLFGRRQTKES